MKTSILAAFLACLSLTLATPVRVAHTIPDAPSVDVYVDDTKAFSNIAYKTITDYADLTEGTHTYSIRVAGTNTEVLSGSFVVSASPLTVAAVGDLSSNSISVAVWVDDNTDPADGKTRVKFVHASWNAPAVDIYAGSTELFDDIYYLEVASYQEVDGGSYDLEVRVSGTSTVALTVNDLQLDAGTVYTVYAVGNLTGDGNEALTAIVSEDASSSNNGATGLTASVALVALGLIAQAVF